MMVNSIRFSGLFLTALVVGTTFGIWLGYNPSGFSYPTYVEQQQHAITALNTIMPILGGICIMLNSVLAALTTGDKFASYIIIAAVILLVATALITNLGNQPINAIVMTWNPQVSTDNWMELRDSWWKWHILRTSTGSIAFAMLLIAALRVKTQAQ